VLAGAAEFIDARRKLMSYIAAALLALVPWMQASACSLQHIVPKHRAFIGFAASNLLHAVVGNKTCV
jgi:hypothetical protein